jgi:DNA-directed RNA polymerase specialized sigma24 family protein
MAQGNPVSKFLCRILTAAFLSAMRRRQRMLASVPGTARNADRSTATRSIPVAGGKNSGLA